MKHLVLLWLITLAACFAFVKLVALGPVILTISAKHGWGVHTGDLLTLLPLAAITGYTVYYFASVR